MDIVRYDQETGKLFVELSVSREINLRGRLKGLADDLDIPLMPEEMEQRLAREIADAIGEALGGLDRMLGLESTGQGA